MSNNDWQQGYQEGNSSSSLLSDYQITMKSENFAVGYVVGRAEREASSGLGPYSAAFLAGQLTKTYGLPVKRVRKDVLEDLLKLQLPEALTYFENGYAFSEEEPGDEEE